MKKPGRLVTVVGVVLCSLLLMAQSIDNGNTKIMYPVALSCTSSPAVSTRATCSIAADPSKRHVPTCVGFSAGSTTAPALTQLKVELRDGASGAGTVIWQKVVIITAAAAQNVQAHTVCGDITRPGTVNTAMTLEFTALLTSLFEEVSLSVYDIDG